LFRANSVHNNPKHRKCEHFFELQQMLKMSSTRLHVLSQPLSKTRDSFVLRKIVSCFFPVRLFKKLFGFGRSSQKCFMHRSLDMISAVQGIQIWRVRWPLFLLNHLQTVREQALLRHVLRAQSPCISLICRSVRQQSVAVFNKFWKHKLINSSITVCKNINTKIKLQ